MAACNCMGPVQGSTKCPCELRGMSSIYLNAGVEPPFPFLMMVDVDPKSFIRGMLSGLSDAEVISGLRVHATRCSEDGFHTRAIYMNAGADRLEAALTNTVIWEPIQSAPCDGTKILASGTDITGKRETVLVRWVEGVFTGWVNDSDKQPEQFLDLWTKLPTA